NNVVVWDTDKREELHTLTGHTRPCVSLAFGPDGQQLATASLDQTVKVWDLATGQERLTLKNNANVVAFSPDGRRLATGGDDSLVKIWDPQAPDKELYSLAGHKNKVLQLAFSPDGRRLASTGADHLVILWDVTRGQRLNYFIGHNDVLVTGLAFS